MKRTHCSGLSYPALVKLIRPVSTFFGSKPGGTFVSSEKLLIIKPAPTSRIKLRATSETTSELRQSRKLRPLVADFEDDFRTSLTSGCEALSVGTKLKSKPVNRETASVKNNTFELMLTSLILGN